MTVVSAKNTNANESLGFKLNIEDTFIKKNCMHAYSIAEMQDTKQSGPHSEIGSK